MVIALLSFALAVAIFVLTEVAMQGVDLQRFDRASRRIDSAIIIVMLASAAMLSFTLMTMKKVEFDGQNLSFAPIFRARPVSKIPVERILSIDTKYGSFWNIAGSPKQRLWVIRCVDGCVVNIPRRYHGADELVERVVREMTRSVPNVRRA